MWKVKRMNPARIAVLAIAIVAGGIAAYLASGSDDKPAPVQAVAQLQTVDVLVAKNEIGLGQSLKTFSAMQFTLGAMVAGLFQPAPAQQPFTASMPGEGKAEIDIGDGYTLSINEASSEIIVRDADGNGVHGLNERIRVKSFYEGHQFLNRLIRALAAAR